MRDHHIPAVPDIVRQPLSLGQLPLPSRFFLAPLAGYTSLAFRLAVRDCGGLGLATTDLVNARSLIEGRRRALELFEQGCARGSPAACDRAGQSYLRGDGGRAEPVAAARLFGMACHGGHSPACAEAAAMFDRGLGVPRDLALASGYLRRACSLGTEFACQPGERTE